MPRLLNTILEIERCPHCRVDRPHLQFLHQWELITFSGTHRFWRAYFCNRCAAIVTAVSTNWNMEVAAMYPSSTEVSSDLPERARNYLHQAVSSLSAPAGAVMLAASAVDEMLKQKGLTEGSLYTRIDTAVTSHLITKEMAQWAHDVRLDANDQRHSDRDADLPTPERAQKCVDFAQALAQLLYVLPKRVERGILEAKPQGVASGNMK